MSIKQRVERLEAQHKAPGMHYATHSCIMMQGLESGITRVDCPTCAAMSDEEYAAYREWWAGPGRKGISHVVISRAAEEPLPQQSAEVEEESAGGRHESEAAN